MSAFKHYPRAWCERCDKRTLKKWMSGAICLDCRHEIAEQIAHDEEMESLRGYTDEERARI